MVKLFNIFIWLRATCTFPSLCPAPHPQRVPSWSLYSNYLVACGQWIRVKEYENSNIGALSTILSKPQSALQYRTNNIKMLTSVWLISKLPAAWSYRISFTPGTFANMYLYLLDRIQWQEWTEMKLWNVLLRTVSIIREAEQAESNLSRMLPGQAAEGWQSIFIKDI